MAQQVRVLVVEDDPKWQKMVLDTLSRNGIAVDLAVSEPGALALLESRCYHLLVLDIELNKVVPNDDEGLHLLETLHERDLDKCFSVVVLTAHGSMERMHDAFAHFHVAEFIEKRYFRALDFLEIVRSSLAKMKFRADLVIHWPSQDTTRQLVTGLALGNDRVVADQPALVTQGTEELTDLLCRLFHQANSVITTPLTPGFSGARILRVQPFLDSGAARPVIVKFGSRARIDEEWQSYDTYVAPFIGGRRSTSILERECTIHLGGIKYSLLDADADRVRSFGQFFRESSLLQVRKSLRNLFLDTCRHWYANLGPLEPCNLTMEYQEVLNFTLERLDRILIEQLTGVEVTSSGLKFGQLTNEHTFTNPIPTVGQRHIVLATYRCTTHGDPNQNNILVDDGGHAWLIDFMRTGRSHWLRDFVLLDSVVRFELLAASDATLDERLGLEQLLLATESYNERRRLRAGAKLSNPSIAKAFAIVVYLRSLAQRLAPEHQRDDWSGYNAGLLLAALNATKFKPMAMVQREHALLCASLLTDHMMARSQTAHM